MKLHDGRTSHSATDLAHHLSCRHLTTLARQVAAKKRKWPHRTDPAIKLLQRRGDEHEKRYLATLRAQGSSVEELTRVGNTFEEWQRGHEATLSAMRSGVDVIYQATLFDGSFLGRPDFLVRSPRPSALGDHSYDVVDAKLAQETRGESILQLCVYAELLTAAQGAEPGAIGIVRPGEEPTVETYRFSEFAAYYRRIKRSLLAHGEDEPTYPEPCDHCDVCDFWQECDQRRRGDDHLSLVAGVTRRQRDELGQRGIDTLEKLGRVHLPLEPKLQRTSEDSVKRLHQQARLQLDRRVTGKPSHELLPVEPELGLAALPPPSSGDVYLDFEADRFDEGGSFEYLMGYAYYEQRDEFDADARDLVYVPLWAETRREERENFEKLIDFLTRRRGDLPGMHVYHYAPYERAAVGHLMGRYGTREEAVDDLFRGDVFVDLLQVVRQSLRASVERYSIKELEIFYGFERKADLRAASRARRDFELLRSAKLLGENPSTSRGEDESVAALRSVIQQYNEDDVVSTLRLHEWLEELRSGLLRSGTDVPRPSAKKTDEGAEDETSDVERVREQLMSGIPEERDGRNEEQQAQWLLAQLLDWYRREKKPMWWNLFHLRSLSPQEWIDDGTVIGGLEYVGIVGEVKRSSIHQYRFPEQDFSVKEGDEIVEPIPAEQLSPGKHPFRDVGKVHALNVAQQTIEFKKQKGAQPPTPSVLIPHKDVRDGVLREALLTLGKRVAASGVGGPHGCRASLALLLGRPPRCLGERSPGERVDALAFAQRVACDLDEEVFAIQGPPGAGKTFTAAHMIVALVQSGKKVGITANGHRVIRNLLKATHKIAGKRAVSIKSMQKVTEEHQLFDHPNNRKMKDKDKPVELLAAGEIQVLVGTAWLWASDSAEAGVDVLFIDEAGQFSLAQALASARGARSLVLIGDPQQLPQPLQGSHPDGAEASALGHYLGKHQTMPDHLGLFLPRTWRMHPSICEFNSELFYAGSLGTESKLSTQRVLAEAPFDGAGLRYVPVPHAGNTSESPEEVERIAELVRNLLARAPMWIDADGKQHPLTSKDILIVAPYNAQVVAIAKAIPDAVVGTVDKFQGEQAPVVVYSCTTSSAQEAPRGLDFIFSPNRLNVAISRARCIAALVCSPELMAAECRTPAQMKLVNAFCRYEEMANRH